MFLSEPKQSVVECCGQKWVFLNFILRMLLNVHSLNVKTHHILAAGRVQLKGQLSGKTVTQLRTALIIACWEEGEDYF